MLRIMMLLAKARSGVMFAHYAVRRNIIHAVNITAAGNIICPQGQTSFSVNAPFGASRYAPSAFLSKLLTKYARGDIIQANRNLRLRVVTEVLTFKESRRR